MVTAIQTPSVGAGLCPHGLPYSACPVCSKMMGGASKVQTADFSAKPGEMSWNECAAIGAFLKSLRNARMARDNDYQQHLVSIIQFQNNMEKMSKNLQVFIQNMSQSALAKPLVFVAQNVLLPVVNIIKDIPVKFLQTTANLAQKVFDISDKLAAIYGELKAAIDKKISDFSKRVKKKIVSLFEIFKSDNMGSDDERIEDYERYLNKVKTLLDDVKREIRIKLKGRVKKEVIYEY